MVKPSKNFGRSLQLLTNFLGLTETSTVVCSTAVHDVWYGSSGSLLPMVQAKIMSTDGVEITDYDQPGELVVKSPSVVLGYLNNDKASKETFQNGWMRTGDEAVVSVSPKGYENIFIVDRIKELIKVKASKAVGSLLFPGMFVLRNHRACKSRLQSWRLTF